MSTAKIRRLSYQWREKNAEDKVRNLFGQSCWFHSYKKYGAQKIAIFGFILLSVPNALCFSLMFSYNTQFTAILKLWQ